MGFIKHFSMYILLIAQGLFVINSFERNGSHSDTGTNDDLLLSSLTTEPTIEITEKHNATEEIDEEFAECGAFLLEPTEYILLPNNSVYVEHYNKTYDPSAYLVRDDFIIVCPPTYEDEDENVDDDESSWKFDMSFTYITRIGLTISMFCLILHLIAFCVVPDMRNLPGYNLASLCISLLFGYMSFMVAHANLVQNSTIPCICAAAAFQFFMLSAFLWMSTLALDIFRSLLKATGKLRLVSRTFNCKKYSTYCLYSWGTPLLFVTVTLVLDNVEGIPENLKPVFGTKNICWFRQRIPLLLLFALPAIIITISNIILFAFSAYIIYSNQMRIEGNEAYKNMLKRNFLMHGRLATIMGISWFVGVLASVFDTQWLWYTNTLVNSFQGLFIFLAFTCTPKIKKHVVATLSSHRSKMSSSRNSLPTFTSYWNSGLSLESDIDTNSADNVVNVEKV